MIGYMRGELKRLVGQAWFDAWVPIRDGIRKHPRGSKRDEDLAELAFRQGYAHGYDAAREKYGHD